MFAEPSLPHGISCDVRAVVVEQGRLDLALTGVRQQLKFIGPAIRVVGFRMRVPYVALFGRLKDIKVLSCSGWAAGSAQYFAIPAHFGPSPTS